MLEKLMERWPPELLLEAVSIAVTILLAVAGGTFLLYRWINRPEHVAKRNARKKLLTDAGEAVRGHREDPLFRREGLQLRFSRWMTLQSETGRLYINRPPWFQGSCLVTGEAGCGKSAVLQHDFRLRWQMRRWTGLFSAKTSLCFLDAAAVINLLDSHPNGGREILLERIQTAELSRLFLYVDGVDELPEEQMEAFQQLLRELRERVRILVPRYSCRTAFAQKYLRQERFDSHFTVEPWTQLQLQRLGKQLLGELAPKYPGRVREAEAYLNGRGGRLINSPLLLRLLLYVKIHSVHNLSGEENRYAFYSVFFRTLIEVYESQTHQTAQNAEEVLDQAAREVFDAFIQGEKSIPFNAALEPLLKQPLGNSNGQRVALTHETFYEYLTARHYFRQFQERVLTKAAVEVLKTGYSNDYADFITDAFRAAGTEQQTEAMQLMCQLYEYTLTPEVRESFHPTFSPDDGWNREVADAVESLNGEANRSGNPFLTLKYEILFRFGRFDPLLQQEFRLEFLEFVYWQVTNTGTIYDSDYFTAVLKRCCAISSSFLGGEEIELDYVRHMPDFKDCYDPNYDLANRSHTLVYYGDVPNSNIYAFRDSGAESGWTFARTKRLERLTYPLPDTVSCMDAAAQKKYRFRVFDLATVYTFLRSRPLQTLSEKEVHVLISCKIDLVGMNPLRRTLLEELKTETLKLLNKSPSGN